jgi:hypothetical protein
LKDTERDAKYELKIQQMNRKSTFWMESSEEEEECTWSNHRDTR